MKVFVVLAVCIAAVVAQQRPHHGHHTPSPERIQWWENMQAQLGQVSDDIVDNIHNFRFEYHAPDNGTHLLIAISDANGARECHFVEIGPDWEPLMGDEDKVNMMSEELYQIISSGSTTETTLTEAQLKAIYGDTQASRECWHHTIKVLAYSPSASIIGTNVSG